MRQIPRRDRPSPGQELFAPRQVYVRSGGVSQYVTLSRPLQIAVAAGMALIVLWLGLASYAAVAKHWETLVQQRELTRLESVSKTLRTSFEALRASFARAQDERAADDDGAASGDLAAQLGALQASRDRALKLADAAAGEADALRREVALAYERIRELELAELKNQLDETVPASLVGGSTNGMRLAGNLLDPVACPVP
jgi:hypothetical protein